MRVSDTFISVVGLHEAFESERPCANEVQNEFLLLKSICLH